MQDQLASSSSLSLSLSDLTTSQVASSPSSSSSEVDTEDDDEDMAIVFFGKPSAEEEERRRAYEMKLRRRKLVRRDSLDLARRKTIVFVDGDKTDPEEEPAPRPATERIVAEEQETQEPLPQEADVSAQEEQQQQGKEESTEAAAEVLAQKEEQAQVPLQQEAASEEPVKPLDQAEESEVVAEEAAEVENEIVQAAAVDETAPSLPAAEHAEEEEPGAEQSIVYGTVEDLEQNNEEPLAAVSQESSVPDHGDEDVRDAALVTGEATELSSKVMDEQLLNAADHDTSEGSQSDTDAGPDIGSAPSYADETLCLQTFEQEEAATNADLSVQDEQQPTAHVGEDEAASQPGESVPCSPSDEQNVATPFKSALSASPATPTPVRTPNAEASILLNRSLIVCTPTSALASGSFSMDYSPGLGRALVAPPSDIARRIMANDALNDVYGSPAGSYYGDENVVQGSYMGKGHGDRKAQRRSSRPSLRVLSPAKSNISEQEKAQRTSESPERKVLSDINGSFQQQEQDTFESPSADKLQRAQPRSRSVSPSKNCHDRSQGNDERSQSLPKSSKKNDNRSPGSSRSPRKMALVMTSPTVRSALKAWAGAKMMTPYSPEKRAQSSAVHGLSLPTPQSVLADRTVALQPLSSPIKATPAFTDRPGAALFSGSLRSPTKVPVAPTPTRGETKYGPFNSAARPTVECYNTTASSPTRATLQALNSSPLRPAAASNTAPQESPRVPMIGEALTQAAAIPSSAALHAPRIARTLQSAASTSQARSGVHSQPIAAGSINRAAAPRKPELASSQLKSAEDLGNCSITSSGGGPSTAAKKAIVSSGLPRPIGGALPSRLPKPAAFKSAVPSAPVRPTKPETVPAVRTAPVPIAATTIKATTSTQRPIASATTRPTPQPSVASKASLAASRAGVTSVTIRKPLSSSATARNIPLRGTGGAMRHPVAPSRGPTMSEPEQPSATPVQESGPIMSMLERSLQMQARVLARISPDQGEAKADVGDMSMASATAHDQVPQPRPIGFSVSAGRVWSPVKPPGSAARLGASGTSPIKQPEYLRREPGLAVANTVPPSRFGVSVSTAMVTSATPAVAVPRAVRPASPLKAASVTSKGGLESATSGSSEDGRPSPEPSSDKPVVAPRARSARSRAAQAEANALQEGNVSSPPPSSDTGNGDRPARRTRAVRSAAAAASTKISNAASSAGASSYIPFNLSSSTSSNGLDRVPVLPISAAELTRLTSQHTRRNEVYLAKLDVRVERREGPRPPSPSAKMKEAPPVASNKKKGSKRNGADEEEDDETLELNRHVLAKGDDEPYATPPKLATTVDVKPKGVRWFKPLFVGPTVPSEDQDEEDQALKVQKARRKSCVASKEYRLDRHGNPIETELEPLSPRMRKTKVVIKKVVYDDDEQP